MDIQIKNQNTLAGNAEWYNHNESEIVSFKYI